MTSTIRELYRYPIKSLAGIACSELSVGDRGADGDRRWMLVDENGRFITQREHPELCMLNVSQRDNGFSVEARRRGMERSVIHIPAILEYGEEIRVQVWSDTMLALQAPEEINLFFSEALAMSCRLVYMPEHSHRFVDSAYVGEGVLNSFSDGYPLLLIGTASLDELNGRLLASGEPTIGWDRFRPNIVAETNEEHCEDAWAEFKMGAVQARGVKLCSRCVFTTINQVDGSQGKEPLKTLANYRNMGGKIMFGQNVIAKKGILQVGDSIEVVTSGLPPNAKF
jgi:uncharacterized protein YcbX